MDFSDLAGARVTIWGFGREGKSVAEHLTRLGISFRIAVPDQAQGDEPILRFGADGREALLSAEVVIKSPGVPVTSPLYAELVDRGIRFTSLSDLWLSTNAARTVAVTGSKGKSTTAALLAHILRVSGRDASLRGNIGTSVLTEPTPPSDVVVMEVSSYQAQSLTVSPRMVVVTSLFPEHQTWHGSAEAYFRDKLNVLNFGPEVVVVPGGDVNLVTRVTAAAVGAAILTTGDATVGVDDHGDLVWPQGLRLSAASLPLLGRHQVGNAALAALASESMGVQPQVAAAAIAGFSPLPHRLEPVPSTDGRTWIDDSLATAPEAVVATISALPHDQPISVLVGGSDRGLDMSPLVRYLTSHKHVSALLSGPAGVRISAEGGPGRLFDSFADAAAWAWSNDNEARVVLLCPGAPSFDEFESYEHKAAAFRRTAMTVPR